ncbi:hypothetical protein EK904_013184, partial [Melospiza melodia maxima]
MDVVVDQRRITLFDTVSPVPARGEALAPLPGSDISLPEQGGNAGTLAETLIHPLWFCLRKVSDQALNEQTRGSLWDCGCCPTGHHADLRAHVPLSAEQPCTHPSLPQQRCKNQLEKKAPSAEVPVVPLQNGSCGFGCDCAPSEA